jgi:hypothetical protein
MACGQARPAGAVQKVSGKAVASSGMGQTKAGKTQEEEIDIDLNDPQVQAVTRKMQGAFFRRKSSMLKSKSSGPAKTAVLSTATSQAAGDAGKQAANAAAGARLAEAQAKLDAAAPLLAQVPSCLCIFLSFFFVVFQSYN